MTDRKDDPIRDAKNQTPAAAAAEFVFAAMNQVAAGTQETEELEVHEEWDLKSVTFPRANLRGPELTITPPASVSGSINARRLLEQVCEANNLGTHRPAAFLISINADKTMLWLLPVVNTTSPSALPITYDRFGFHVNLYKPFRLLSRLVQEGTREVYALQTTSKAIKVGDSVGRALVIQLNQYTRQNVRHVSDEVKAERQARRAARRGGGAGTSNT